MRLLFTLDSGDYDPAGTAFVRPSARGILIRRGKAAMLYSRKYNYYAFPGGGIEPGESEIQALLREVREETGLLALPESVREYGRVHREQKGTREARFVQENYYYFFQAQEQPALQRLTREEAEEGFSLEWVAPEKAIAANRGGVHGPKDPFMLEREARVLELLVQEGYLPGETAPACSACR